jgi:phenylpropionate dioxygenase-like ring-hydroxylating dioxygenase large terminal subunit
MSSTKSEIKSGDEPIISWPSTDHTLIPCEVYLDQAIFDKEQELIFRGPNWFLLGSKADIPSPGDYLCTYIGTTPVVLQRAHDNSINAYVNSCAHRGARVIKELRGNIKYPTCPYHNWRYDGTGKLIGVPLEQGVGDNDGYPDNFNKDCHGLKTLKIEQIKDIIFANFDHDATSVRESLGKVFVERIENVCQRPLRIVGYQRQTLQCNWKIYLEGYRDSYHAPQLHSFITQFGLAGAANRTNVDIHNGHAMLSAWLPDNGDTEFPEQKGRYKLEDPSVIEGYDALDGLQLTIMQIYPSSTFSTLRNNWIYRRIIPTSPTTTDMEMTWFGYEDDTEFERECIRKQTNLSGLSGYIGLEDAEVIANIQNSISSGDTSYVEFGGASIEASSEHFNSEGSVRSFWKAYCESMNISTS